MATIFERYGGFAKVSRIVSAFYGRILDSPITSPYFEKVDMKLLLDHQTKFVASLMGGPASYTHEHLQRVHHHLQITDPAFVEVLDMLRDSLEDFDMDETDISAVMQRAISAKRYIVSTGVTRGA
jgi:hemoglobin